MPDCTDCIRNVPRQTADIGAFGDIGGECDGVQHASGRIHLYTKVMHRHGTRFHLHDRTCPRQVIGPLTVNLYSRISRRNLRDGTGKLGKRSFNLRQAWAVIGCRNDIPFCIQAAGFCPKADCKVIGLRCVQHTATQFGRFAQSNRQNARGQRVKRSAMTHLDLAKARFTQISLYGRNRLR